MKKNLTKLFALLMVAIMLLGLTACGKGGTDVTGKYTCIAISLDGTSFTAPLSDESYVELKKGGKGTISDTLSFEMTWKLDGESFSGSYKIFGIDVPITGTLKDGILEIHDENTVTRYLKAGAEMPDWAKNLESAQSDEGRLAGHYTMYAIDLSGTHYDYAALLELDMIDNSYIDIEYDKLTGYTGEICFDGEEPNSFTYDEVSELLTTDVGELLNFYESESGVMCLVYEELGGSFYFALDSVERSGMAAPAANDDPLLSWWNGDWYGWWFMYGCKGSYTDLEGAYWDCEAHIEIGSTYTGTMEMWDDEQYQNMGGIGMVDVSLSDSGVGEHGTLMSVGGWFEEMELEHADWIIDPALSGFENMIIITGDFDDGNGNSYYFKMMMRPWGQLWEDVDAGSRPWSYENWYKPMIEDGVTKMSVRFGDHDPSVYEDLDTAQTEDQEPQRADAAGSGAGVSTAGYGKSNAAATGEVSLETLKAVWETIRGDDNKYDLLYEDVRDLMGCDGEPYKIDGVKNSYCWQSGSAKILYGDAAKHKN